MAASSRGRGGTRRESAGLLMYRRRPPAAAIEVLAVHPGGPFFAAKDDGAWTIPKGEIDPGEAPLASAVREFEEETGFATAGAKLDLGSVKQANGKLVRAWAFEGDCDPAGLRSNSFELEWPPRSGRRQSFPEVDRAAFFDPATARRKLNPAQAAFVDRLIELLERP